MADMSERGIRPPWFSTRPRLAITVALVLYAGVFTLRLAVHGLEPSINSLYALPVALVAFSFGTRAGIAAGSAGISLTVVWAAMEGTTRTTLGWASRAVPLLLLGVLVGRSSDQLRAVDDLERDLIESEITQREAAEINDSIVQGLAAAKWAFEAGASDRGLEVLDETIRTSQTLVSDLLAGSGPGARRVSRANGRTLPRHA